jgi:magnesium chelatase family protein
MCTCTADRKRRYRARISGPVRDRIDIVHTVLPVTRAEMRERVGESGTTAAVAARVSSARQRQRARFAMLPWQTNGEIPGYEFRRLCSLDATSAGLIEDAVGGGSLTQRGADRVARLAWTLADLAGEDTPRPKHVLEALYLRTDGLVGRCSGSRSVA